MNQNQLRCDSDSEDIDFGEDGVAKLTPSTSKSDQHLRQAKRRKTSRQLPHPVMFDSTTEEEEESDVDIQETPKSATRTFASPDQPNVETPMQFSRKRKDRLETPAQGRVINEWRGRRPDNMNNRIVSFYIIKINKALRSMLTQVLEQQAEILQRIKNLERKEEERLESKKEEKVYVPPSVRIAVKDGYSDGLKRGFSWTFDKTKHQDSENEDMSRHIANFVKGWNASIEEDVLQCALKRYFLSKKQEASLQQKNKFEDQKRKRVVYERKKEKAKRRTVALGELGSKGWKTEENRAQIKKILKVEYMSSDEECDDGFITHPPSWQSETFAKLKGKLDTVYLDICSKKSRRLIQKRTVGSSHVKSVPKYPEECSWMIKND